MIKKNKSTFEEHYESLNSKRKKEFDADYKELLISEMLLAAMEEDDISVRELAAAADISPTIVQGLRSGSRKNVTVKSLFKMLKILGYSLLLEKNGKLFPVDMYGSNES